MINFENKLDSIKKPREYKGIFDKNQVEKT